MEFIYEDNEDCTVFIDAIKEVNSDGTPLGAPTISESRLNAQAMIQPTVSTPQTQSTCPPGITLKLTKAEGQMLLAIFVERW